MMRQRLDYALALDKHYCQSEFISKTIQENYIPVITSALNWSMMSNSPMRSIYQITQV